MQVVANKEKLYINQVIGQKQETITVEEDFVVPDVKPDILNTIHSSGTVCIYKKEIIDGKIRIDGCVNTYIMYLADGSELNVRGLNTNIKFSEIIDFDGVKPDMMINLNTILKNIECRVLNGRKVNIRVSIDFILKISSNEEVEFVSQIDGCDDIQLLNEKMELNSLLGNNITRAYAKDTIILDNIDNLVEILKADVNIINKESKISYNKVLVKADACFKIIYLNEDGRICNKVQLIPVMGFIDMPNISDDDICDVNYEIKNLIVKPNNMEEHSVYVEVEIEISCNSFNTKEVNLIQDLYSPCYNLNYEQKQIHAISEKKVVKDICCIREKQTIPEIGENRLYNVDVKPIINKQTILNNKIVYEGEIELTFMYESSISKSVDLKTVNIPFNYNMEYDKILKNLKEETNIYVTLQDFTVMTDQVIDIKIDLEFISNMYNPKNINVIDKINVDETRNNEGYSLVIYFVKKGDTLWNIAKRFHSTIQNIVDINEIEDANMLNIGQQLFIPISI